MPPLFHSLSHRRVRCQPSSMPWFILDCCLKIWMPRSPCRRLGLAICRHSSHFGTVAEPWPMLERPESLDPSGDLWSSGLRDGIKNQLASLDVCSLPLSSVRETLHREEVQELARSVRRPSRETLHPDTFVQRRPRACESWGASWPQGVRFVRARTHAFIHVCLGTVPQKNKVHPISTVKTTATTTPGLGTQIPRDTRSSCLFLFPCNPSSLVPISVCSFLSLLFPLNVFLIVSPCSLFVLLCSCFLVFFCSL